MTFWFYLRFIRYDDGFDFLWTFLKLNLVPNSGNCVAFHIAIIATISTTIKEVCSILSNLVCISSPVPLALAYCSLYHLKNNYCWGTVLALIWLGTNYGLYFNCIRSWDDHSLTRYTNKLITQWPHPNPKSNRYFRIKARDWFWLVLESESWYGFIQFSFGYYYSNDGLFCPKSYSRILQFRSMGGKWLFWLSTARI